MVALATTAIGIALMSVWYDLYPWLRAQFSDWEWQLH